MAKGRRKRQSPRPPMQPRQRGSGGGGLQQQAMRLQEEMLKAQEALKDETVTATSGGGVVTVIANGHQEVQSIAIQPEVVDPEDVEMLQDLVLAAVNEALEKSRELVAERMSAFTGGLNIPGLT
jgi:DNA-binding YbaB/EbfC family protein